MKNNEASVSVNAELNMKDVKKELDIFFNTTVKKVMADLFHELKPIRISGNQWHNYVKVTKLLTSNSDISEEHLKSVIEDAGLRYDWYLKTKEIVNPASLDMTISEDSDADIYNFLVYNDNEVRRFESQSYIDYIVDSAIHGIKLERDKELIRTFRILFPFRI